MNDPTGQFAQRTIKAISEDDSRSPVDEEITLHHTAFAVNTTSDRGLDRIWQWLDSMTRHYPLDGILFQQHRTLIEGLRDDIAAEMARREGRNGS